jgi:DNA-binding beta-propeller fold protein YncE
MELIVTAATVALGVQGCGGGQSPPKPTQGGGGSGGGSPANDGASSGTGGGPAPSFADAAAGIDAAQTVAAADAGLPPADTGGGGPRPPQPGGPGKIVLIAGGGNGGDGSPAAMAKVNTPFGVAADPLDGAIYIAEYGGGHVRRVDGQGIISTVMGSGAMGPGGSITLGQPHNLVFQPHSHILFVADTFAGRVIRMDTATGEAAVFAGRGTPVAANAGTIYCLAFDPAGENLYLSAGGVTVINIQSKAVKTLGMPTPGILALDSKKNLYAVTGRNGTALRVVDPAGAAMNVMGGGGLAAPKGIAIDLDDDVILAETESGTITRWSATTRTITKLAGGGGGTGMLGGAPAMAGLNRPHGVSVDGQGRILIADSFNNRVLRIDY